MRKDWVEVELGEVCDFVGGGTPSKSNSDFWGGSILWASIKDIKGDYLHTTQDSITELGLKMSASNVAEVNEIIIATRINPGRPIIVKTRTSINQDLKITKPKIDIETKFLFQFFKYFEKEVLKVSSGTTVLGINLNNLRQIKIPLAPLPEQRAIVAKIEQLLSELDNGISNLNAAKSKLEIYRQAVLKKAFEGELTKEWRDSTNSSANSGENLPNGWKSKKIMDLARVGTGATPSRSQLEFWENGTIPWITSSVVNYSQVTKYSELITEKALLKTNCKLVPKGTIIMALYGEGKTRGKVSVLKIEAATNQALATIITNSNVLYNIFLKWFFVYSYELTRLKSSGGVQPNINLSIVKNTVIPLPPLPEQHRIVEEIETRLSVCDNVLANIDEALNKSQALRQSILKQAFEGKLLSDEELEDCRRDPDWEPAEKLLDRIMNQKPARV